MNAIVDNAWSRGFASLVGDLPEPSAILCISAHWYGDGTKVTGNSAPPTIHDFGNFPSELFAVQYPAPGAPDLAERVCALLKPLASVSDAWGLDHGCWSVVRCMYPDAGIPIVQLSLDARLSARAHLELARPLRELRSESVLILASGNVTHNLPDAFERRQRGDRGTPEWAARFDSTVAELIETRNEDGLCALIETELGRQAHPSPEHWWPLIYAYGASDPRDSVAYPITGFDLGSLSMRAVRFG